MAKNFHKIFYGLHFCPAQCSSGYMIDNREIVNFLIKESGAAIDLYLIAIGNLFE